MFKFKLFLFFVINCSLNIELNEPQEQTEFIENLRKSTKFKKSLEEENSQKQSK
uniref:Uncharacterized protein n=1 Tax=Meloidogyne enterolobii TaxID=390850 RepID=A0A6V7WGX9_MELEN|nr:unnamed protein product [Meloidogyne enterolobii]